MFLESKHIPIAWNSCLVKYDGHDQNNCSILCIPRLCLLCDHRIGGHRFYANMVSGAEEPSWHVICEGCAIKLGWLRDEQFVSQFDEDFVK